MMRQSTVYAQTDMSSQHGESCPELQIYKAAPGQGNWLIQTISCDGLQTLGCPLTIMYEHRSIFGSRAPSRLH